MKHIYSVFFLLFISFTSIANNTAWLAPLADKSLILAMTQTSNKLIAVGEYGHILSSVDGKQWQQAYVPNTATLTSVFFLTDKLGWAVGHDSIILYTADGGATWQQQLFLPQLEKPLFDVVFKDDKQGIAIGAYGLFFRTHDGGQTWQQEYHQEFLHSDDIAYLNELKAEDEDAYLDELSAIFPHFNRLLLDNDILYLVGEMGLIAKSYDFGQTWQRFDDIYFGSFFDIARIPNGNLMVIGLRGNIFRSEDNGNSWQQVSIAQNALLNSIILHQQTIYIVGNNGLILHSIDNGNSFQHDNHQATKNIIDGIWFNEQLVIATDTGIKSFKP